MIIYIHGFGSSGQANKAKIFREYFKSINQNFIAPSLSYVPNLAISTLEEIIDSYNEEIYLIGSSLGGYYATYLSLNEKVKKIVLINPAVIPSHTLQKSVGDAINFYDNSSYKWNKEHLNMLHTYNTTKIEKNKFMVLLQKGDKVLNYKDAINKYDGSTLILEDGGDHGFKGIQNHFEDILNFIEKDN